MAYLNRDPGMCRFEPDPARGRNDLVSGQEAALVTATGSHGHGVLSEVPVSKSE